MRREEGNTRGKGVKEHPIVSIVPNSTQEDIAEEKHQKKITVKDESEEIATGDGGGNRKGEVKEIAD